MADLERFVDAQADVYDQALAELHRGRKSSHWMWFVFPQIAGLGHSPMARRYAIADLAEARAYLAHPLLGPRLRACAQAMLAHAGRSAEAILGEIDAVKLRSSMTLFELAGSEAAVFEAEGAEAGGGDTVFARVLGAFYDGRRDDATLTLVEG